MATFTSINKLTQDLANKVHNLASDQLVVALTNTAPEVTDEGLSDITEIDYSDLSSRNLTTISSIQTAGTYKLVLNNLTLTASGTIPTFRYIVIYNDTSTGDKLLGWFDAGAEVNLVNETSYSIIFSDSGVLFEIAPE